MNNLILPFAFCSLLLLLAQICPAQSSFTKYCKNISLCCGIIYLGNLVALNSINFRVEHSDRIYCMVQVICYLFLIIFSEDKQTIIVNIKNSNNKEEIRV